jgi:hypothetical protein
MRLYLDSNVYSYILETRESREARALFAATSATVLSSDTVVLEAARIPDREQRLARMAAIRCVATRRISPPFAFRQAMEVLAEMRRCRPEWLEPVPATRTIERILAVGERNWKRLRNDVLFDPAVGLPEYLNAAGSSGAEYLRRQREFRQIRLNSRDVAFQAIDPEFQPYLEPFSQPERYWRLNSAGIWAAALKGAPHMSDYRDFLEPFLRRISDVSAWLRFWYVDVNADAMPLGRLHSAAEYYQPSRPVTHGNILDAHHAIHLADCDRLLTCDHDLFKVLLLIRAEFPATVFGQPVLVRRRPQYSAVEAIREALRDANCGGLTPCSTGLAAPAG